MTGEYVRLMPVFVTYEQAKKLVEFYKEARKTAPMAEARRSATRLLHELENVRNIDYSPLKGHQLFLHKEEYEFLQNTIDALGI